jgi:hypothetical protein
MSKQAPHYDRYYDFRDFTLSAVDTGKSHIAMTDNRMRKPGLEPGRVSPLDPKSSASTNSATSAARLMCIPNMHCISA